MNMREKMARAITKYAGLHKDNWPPLLPMVDVILDAMREPTREVIEAGNVVSEDAGGIWEPSDGISYDGPSCGLEVWQAMIDAIKAEGK